MQPMKIFLGRRRRNDGGKICEDHLVGELKTGDLAGVYGYDIYYNKTNYELAYTVEYVEDKVIVVIMAGTRENFYDQLK